jgi:prepilin-type N-terminal cleavage/methylation domain-containing protein
LNRSGFTLIELIFVLVLVASLAGLTTPLFRRTYAAVAVQEAAHNLARTMDYARQRAVMEGLTYRVQLDGSQSAYWLSVEKNPETPGVFSDVKTSWGRRVRLPRGVDLKTDLPWVAFYPNGTATPADVQVAETSGRTSRVSVDPILGQASVHDAVPNS